MLSVAGVFIASTAIESIAIKSIEIVTWIIYDAMGKVVLVGDYNKIETSQFVSGVYYLEISNKKSDNKKTIKLIKN